MELDLKTRVWRQLSGYFVPSLGNGYSCPGLRKGPVTCVGKDKDQMYVLLDSARGIGCILTGSCIT